MTKVTEIFFRNSWKLLALLLAPVLISGVIIFLLPREYQANANLLAGQRYAVIGATGLESDLQSSPAATQATALTELLQTRSFCLAVAHDTDLTGHLGVSSRDTQQVQDALYAEISTHVTVEATGYQLYSITYANSNPTVAMQVVRSVVAHFGSVSSAQAAAEGQQLLATYQGQLKSAQQAADDAAQAAAQYLQEHHLTLTDAQTDPNYQLLSNQAEQTRAALTTVQTNINTVNQQLASLSSGSQGLYQVIDAPTVPNRPESRSKSLLLGGGVGLALGLLASIGYLLILVRLDQSIYSAADMPAISDYPVLVQIPRLPRRSAAWITRVEEEMLSDKGV